jgi:hypothetical protein
LGDAVLLRLPVCGGFPDAEKLGSGRNVARAPARLYERDPLAIELIDLMPGELKSIPFKPLCDSLDAGLRLPHENASDALVVIMLGLYG